jgi:hypothetical protein
VFHCDANNSLTFVYIICIFKITVHETN